MARFLFTLWPIAGHYYPNLTIARALQERGHEVGVYTGSRLKESIESEGFRFFPFRHVDEGLVDNVFYSNPISSSRWKQQIEKRNKYRDWLVGMLQEQVMDLEEVLEAWSPGLILCDPTLWAPYVVLQETHGLKVAIFMYIPACLLPGPDAPPPGLGLPPPTTWTRSVVSKIADRAIRWMTTEIRTKANDVRRQYGLEPLKITVTELAGQMPLYLVAGTRELDYDRRDLPSHVHYVGPCVPTNSKNDPPPAWLDEIRGDTPWVHVTEGTVHVQEPIVLQAAAKGLANLPLQAILATGSHRNPAELGLEPLAPNIHVESWIPYAHLLPRTDVVVTTGGAGTVLSSLMAGIPLVVIPTEWDKPEVAQRVVEAGAGLRLSPHRCTPKRLRNAVETVLEDPGFRENAQRIAAGLAKGDGPADAANLLEGLAERTGES